MYFKLCVVVDIISNKHKDCKSILRAAWHKMNPNYYLRKEDKPRNFENMTLGQRIYYHRKSQIENFPWFIYGISLVSTPLIPLVIHPIIFNRYHVDRSMFRFKSSFSSSSLLEVASPTWRSIRNRRSSWRGRGRASRRSTPPNSTTSSSALGTPSSFVIQPSTLSFF